VLSKIAISGSPSGTATYTIQSPSGSTDRVLTLPDNTGTVLTSATTTGFPAGSVIQVVNATSSTETGSSSSTYADTTLTASITPTSASSKILIIVHQCGIGKQDSNTRINLRLLRGSTELYKFENNSAGSDGGTGANYIGGSGTTYLDSPATTSSTTYKTQLASQANSSAVYAQLNSSTSSITLMEIAA